MAAGEIAATTPYCRSCGWDFIRVNTGTDTICDSCGDTLAESFAGALDPVTDLAAALGTDEVVFTFTEPADTTDIEYSIAGAAFIFDDDVASPYTVAATAVKEVRARVRTVLTTIPGLFTELVAGSSGQSPPTALVVTGESLKVDVAFTADPAADTTDMLYDIGVAAAGTLTIAEPVTDTDPFTLDTQVYRMMTTPVQAFDIFIGANEAATKVNIIAAINASGTPGVEYFAGTTEHPTVSAAVFVGDDAVITAKVAGTAGNAIVSTEVFTHVSNVFDATTLGTTTLGVDVGVPVLVTGVVTGVEIVAAEGEMVSVQVRSVQDGVDGLYSTADSDIALA